jgi:hypothetical protein
MLVCAEHTVQRVHIDPTPYSPLDPINLARSVELTLLHQPCLELPLAERFNGAGLYALYYQGGFEPYGRISSPACTVPIYVGEAMPKGARTGISELDAPIGPVLFNRLRDHWKSISVVSNLEIADFRVRYLVCEQIFIAMGEALLIKQFQPLWNVVVSGFGLHDPGSGRHGSERSEWDELHPGRSWYLKMAQAKTPEDITEKIEAAFAERRTATLEERPAGSSAPLQVDLAEGDGAVDLPSLRDDQAG